MNQWGLKERRVALTYGREEHVVKVNECFDVPSSVDGDTDGQQEDQIARRQEDHAGDVEASRNGVAAVRAPIAFVAFVFYQNHYTQVFVDSMLLPRTASHLQHTCKRSLN